MTLPIRNALRTPMYLPVGWCLAGWVLVCCTGCPDRPKPEPITDDEPIYHVIARVNQNASAMDFLLKASAGTATGKALNPETGQLEPFDANVILFFRKPRNLLAQLSHSLAGTVELGSNHEEFWYWKKTGKREYSYGWHAKVETIDADEMPLRPDLLVEILGINELPVDTTGPNGPLFDIRPEYYVLSFINQDAIGQLFYTKKLFVERRPPYMVRRIVYYDPDGHAMIRAKLDRYEPIEDSCVLAPRRIVIEQLRMGSRVKLEFDRMQRSENREVERLRIDRSPRARGEDLGAFPRRLTDPRLPASKPETLPARRSASR